jgi:hypothetical protein
MARLFEKHLVSVQAWLAKQKQMKTLYVPYAVLLREPEEQIRAVVKFLELPLELEKMLAVPDPSLYRNKK